MVRFLYIIFIIFALYGCAKEVELDKPATYYEEMGDTLASEGKYAKAAERYEQALVRAESPEYAAAIQLALADSYFLAGKYIDAIPVYEVYLEVYQGWESAKLATVRVGLAYFNLVRYASQDQTNTERALFYLEEVKKKYPDLVEEYDVDLRIQLLRERLAKKEMQIAFYYARILKPEPEFLRYKYVVTHYSDTIYYGKAVYKVVKLLLKKDEVDEAEYYLLKLISDDKENKFVEKTKELIDKYKEKKEKERLKAIEKGSNAEKTDKSIEEKPVETVNEPAEVNQQENTADETKMQGNQKQPVQADDNNTQAVPAEAAPEEMN
ncbi:MAG: outer membrane protein assembly factor BamD [Mucispirillum sp.]|nr:outer membrane protein assembly factor BamD [Mucispirillum sp.]